MKNHVNNTIGLSHLTIIVLLIALLIFMVTLIFLSQEHVEKDAFTPVVNESRLKEQREIDKIAAEIKQIRSDTAGSLFWLKMIGIILTVGSAVGGYLIGQSSMTHKRLAFENRKEVDSIFQSIIKELSDKESLLRAAASVKLGKVLDFFPEEWDRGDDPHRRDRIIDLTKQVLAASLSIEEHSKVLKMLTIAIVLHHPWKNDPNEEKSKLGDLRGIDLSGAKTSDAY